MNKEKTIRQLINEPIFRITSLRKEFVNCYTVLALGIVIGLLVGFMIGQSFR